MRTPQGSDEVACPALYFNKNTFSPHNLVYIHKEAHSQLYRAYVHKKHKQYATFAEVNTLHTGYHQLTHESFAELLPKFH